MSIDASSVGRLDLEDAGQKKRKKLIRLDGGGREEVESSGE